MPKTAVPGPSPELYALTNPRYVPGGAMTKRISLALLAVIAFAGCAEEAPEPIPPAPPRPQWAPTVQEGMDGWSVITFKGHTYIERIELYNNSSEYFNGLIGRSVSITHDPDCAKCLGRTGPGWKANQPNQPTSAP